MSSVLSSLSSAASSVGSAVSSGAQAAGSAIMSGAEAFAGGFDTGSMIAGSPEALKAAEEAAKSQVGKAIDADAGFTFKDAAAGVGEGLGGMYQGVSTAFRGVGSDKQYKMGWGEALGSQLGEALINGPSNTDPIGQAQLGTYGGARGGMGFDATGYLTSSFNKDSSPLAYLTSFARGR